MISDAYVRVECNECGECEEVDLIPLAQGAYDGRNLDGWLRRHKWTGTYKDNYHLCPDCVEKKAANTEVRR